MKITINGRDITLRYTFRAMIIYEKICNSSFTGKGITEVLCYLYSTILASDRDNTLTFDDFMDWLDENPEVISEFSEWLANVVNKNSYISKNSEKANSEDSPKNV